MKLFQMIVFRKNFVSKILGQGSKRAQNKVLYVLWNIIARSVSYSCMKFQHHKGLKSCSGFLGQKVASFIANWYIDFFSFHAWTCNRIKAGNWVKLCRQFLLWGFFCVSCFRVFRFYGESKDDMHCVKSARIFPNSAWIRRFSEICRKLQYHADVVDSRVIF